MLYDIVVEGEIIATTEHPRYIRQKAETGVYIECSIEHAEGVAVNGRLFNMVGSTTIPDVPEAAIIERESGEHITRLIEQGIALVESAQNTEDAVCELDEYYDERMAAIEDALCDLDT